jgi:hypothetical protein
MSVLKKIQFADANPIGMAGQVIIGAGVADCQNALFSTHSVLRIPACYIAVR